MGCCRDCCKRECRLRNVAFGYIPPGRFSMFMWRQPPAAYLGYRIIVALYSVVWFILMLVNFTYDGEDMAVSNDLVRVSYSLITLYLVSHAILVLVSCLRQGNFQTLIHYPTPEQHIAMFEYKDHNCDTPDVNAEVINHRGQIIGEVNQQTGSPITDMNNSFTEFTCSTENMVSAPTPVWLSWYYQVIGILHQMFYNISIIIFLMFYLTHVTVPDHLWDLNPTMTYEGNSTNTFQQIDINTMHSTYLQITGLGFFIAVVEMCASAIPTRLIHIIYAQVYFIIYLIVYLAVEIPNTEFDDSVAVFLAILMYGSEYILIPTGAHLLMFGIYSLKCWILQKIYIGHIVN